MHTVIIDYQFGMNILERFPFSDDATCTSLLSELQSAVSLYGFSSQRHYVFPWADFQSIIRVVAEERLISVRCGILSVGTAKTTTSLCHWTDPQLLSANDDVDCVENSYDDGDGGLVLCFFVMAS